MRRCFDTLGSSWAMVSQRPVLTKGFLSHRAAWGAIAPIKIFLWASLFAPALHSLGRLQKSSFLSTAPAKLDAAVTTQSRCGLKTQITLFSTGVFRAQKISLERGTSTRSKKTLASVLKRAADPVTAVSKLLFGLPYEKSASRCAFLMAENASSPFRTRTMCF